MLLRMFAALVLSLAVPSAAQAAVASEGPRPPCGGEAAEPAFPAPGAPPEVRLWHGGELAPEWRLPPCTGWGELRFEQLVGLAGRLSSDVGAEDLLARFGAISKLTGLRYWSASRGELPRADRGGLCAGGA